MCGCSAQAAELRTIALTELPAERITPQGDWESMPWVGTETAPWLAYPGSVTLRVEHGLGYAPSVVLVYIAFNKSGNSPGLAAGDLALVTDINAQFIQIKNGTRSDLFARIVAH
ncbi:MAG: hypothetical protein H6715_03995 [Myxococcales bacterium]|nr:hypothetical protein [Myxococcales bacterium]